MIRGLPVQAKTPAVLSPRSSHLDAGDFENLFQLKLLDLIEALEKFSQSEQNRSVYAIAIGIHEEGYIPSLLINGQEDAPRLDEGVGIDGTANYVFYVNRGNNDERSRKQHLEATLPPSKYDSIFPAYRF
jgi:hypothetical protein